MSELKHFPDEEMRGEETIREFERLAGIETGRTTSEGVVRADSSHQLLQALPAAVYTTDAEGRINFYNEAAAALWGHRPRLGTDEWCGSWRLYWPDGTFLPHHECPMAMALKEGRAIQGMEAAAERPDGTRVPFLAYPTPFFGPSGEVVGAINMLVDISERKTSELAVQRLAAIVESSDDAILSMDLAGVVMSWNEGARLLFGYAEQEILGTSVTILLPPDRQDEEAEILGRIRRGERIEHYETIRQRKDGSRFDAALSVSPIVGQDGRIVGASKIARDVTERKAAERYKDLLLGEMRHRVRNTLALAASICHQTFQSACDEEHSVFTARLQSLANAHEVLSRENWQGACLNAVVLRTIEPHQSGQGQIQVSGPDVAIDSAKAVTIALALHELATNAAKYGALSQPEGTVRIEWEPLPDAPEKIRLEWRERGGPVVGKPARKGFGSRLIERGLASEFDSVALYFEPEGVVCSVVFSRAAGA